MRVGVDIRPLLDRPLSGVGEYTLQLLDALFRDGKEDHYVLFANSKKALPPLPNDWPRERYTIRKYSYPNKLFNAWVYATRRPTLARLVPDVEVFFVPNINFLPSPGGLPYVVTVHDLSYHHYPSLLSRRRRLWHAAVRPRNIIENASGVLAVSHATADDVRKTYGVTTDRIRVVHSGIRTEPVSAQDQQRVRDHFDLPKNFLFSLATKEPRKNFLTLLEAFTALKRDLRYAGDLVIAGAPGWSNEDFSDTVAGHPYRNALHVLPYVSDHEKTSLYASAECFLYLSFYEGFGFPPLEALCQETPVVAGHHTSVSEVLGKRALLVDVYNSKEVAQAVKALLDEPRAREALLDDQETLKRTYSWERAAKETRQALHYFSQYHAHRH